MTSGPSRKIDLILGDYALYHRTKGNIVCHFIGITLIVYGILALLLLIPVVQAFGIQWTATEIVIVACTLYYMTLDVKLAVAMFAEVAVFDWIARGIASPLFALGLFILGWIFQAIGHAVFEKNSPAFFKNLVHLLVGPIFLWNEVLHIRRPATVV